ncbi:histidinol-phosphate aminotransferase family protein, partial [Streptomyces antibioticus]
PPPHGIDGSVRWVDETGPTPPGVPARGGLTAAQVRGTNGLAPAAATGWPNAQAQAQSWPNAAGMGQTG